MLQKITGSTGFRGNRGQGSQICHYFFELTDISPVITSFLFKTNENCRFWQVLGVIGAEDHESGISFLNWPIIDR